MRDQNGAAIDLDGSVDGKVEEKSSEASVSRKGLAFGLILTVASVASGCGQKQEEFDGIACGATDQHKSYMNPMDSRVVQTVSIDSNFTAAQADKIERAIHTWNAVGRQLTGRDLFRAQRLEVAANSVPSPSDDCGFPGTSGSFSIVKVESLQTWTSLGFTKDNPGVTIRCSAGREFARKQVVLLNPTTANTTDSLFETVILHELGHAVGLEHSCIVSGGGANYASCAGKDAGHPYVEAAMYPYVSAGNLKEDLRENDEERTSCALGYRP